VSTRFKLHSKAREDKLRVLDLFSGCGGLSLGFNAAGFEIAGAVELDPLAAASHAQNFFGKSTADVISHHATPRDITKFSPNNLAAEFNLARVDGRRVEVVVGGPPCQAFSIVGRAKLREIKGHPEAFKIDQRAELVIRYLDVVRALQPLAVLIENVPEILRFGARNVAEEVAEELDGMGYVARYTILNAVHYGVPQIRDRMFLVAYNKSLGLEPSFPAPTHFHVLPRGYQNLRRDVVQKLAAPMFGSKYFVAPIENESKGLPAVTAEQALGDLPPISLHIEGRLKRGARRFDVLERYPIERAAGYAKLMRHWSGFENSFGVYDHVIRYLPRDYDIFERMAPGDEYPQAHEKAIALFQERLAKMKNELGKQLTEEDQEYRDLLKRTVPPYSPHKFDNKWRKLAADKPSRTLTAHIGKDTYSHIHYASEQKRTISVREAARLQSFPDGFKFAGTLDPALRQIGNAVPPLLAKAIAQHIMTEIGVAVRATYEEERAAVSV